MNKLDFEFTKLAEVNGLTMLDFSVETKVGDSFWDYTDDQGRLIRYNEPEFVDYLYTMFINYKKVNFLLDEYILKTLLLAKVDITIIKSKYIDEQEVLHYVYTLSLK